MNYNISKPQAPPKKYFNYQNIFYITFALGLIYIFSRVFVQDAVYYRMLAEEKMMTDPSFSYSSIIKFLGNRKFAIFLDLLGRIAIPLSIFCIFLAFKNNSLNYLAVILLALFMEAYYDYFNFGTINLKHNSEFLMIALSVPFFYVWESVKRVKFRWVYRLFMTVLFIVLPIFLNIRAALLYSFYIICLAYFDPVRSNQAIFGALSVFAHGSTMFASVFIYFYDEYFNRKKSNLYYLIVVPIFAILVLILRNMVLS